MCVSLDQANLICVNDTALEGELFVDLRQSRASRSPLLALFKATLYKFEVILE